MDDIADTSTRTTVVVTDEVECRYWCQHFGVRPKDLKRAVRSVGNNPAEVTKYFGPGKMGPNDASHWRATSGL